MIKKKLLPCPFCGQPGVVKLSGLLKNPTWSAGCASYFAPYGTDVAKSCGNSCGTGGHETELAAIKHWNKRAFLPSDQVQDKEKIREVVKDCNSPSVQNEIVRLRKVEAELKAEIERLRDQLAKVDRFWCNACLREEKLIEQVAVMREALVVCKEAIGAPIDHPLAQKAFTASRAALALCPEEEDEK